jgi:hypothetical protein
MTDHTVDLVARKALNPGDEITISYLDPALTSSAHRAPASYSAGGVTPDAGDCRDGGGGGHDEEGGGGWERKQSQADERQKRLRSNYGFDCTCATCAAAETGRPK